MHQDIAFRTAYLLTGSAADAEDAAQAGFVKAWTALPRFRRGSPFKPWLLRIVANEAHNRRRSTGRQEALRHEQREELLAAVSRLDDRDRDALTCRYFLELSEDETAAVLDVRRGTVKSRTARALVRLRRELES